MCRDSLKFPPRGKQTQAVRVTHNRTTSTHVKLLYNATHQRKGRHTGWSPHSSPMTTHRIGISLSRNIYTILSRLRQPTQRAGKLLARSSENLNKFPISPVRFVIVAFPASTMGQKNAIAIGAEQRPKWKTVGGVVATI